MEVQRIPRIICFLKELDLDSNRRVLPDNFIATYGEEIPLNVKLQFPNGKQFDVNYSKSEKALYRLGSMFREFNCNQGNCVIFGYKGDGNFSVNLIQVGYSETEYSVSDIIPQAPIIPPGERGWKFYRLGIGEVLKDGSIDVPSQFRNVFKIPKRVHVVISSGEVYKCFYLKKEKRINGLLPVVKKKYLKLWDILIFTYRGDGRFELAIFEKGVEKLFPPVPEPIEWPEAENNHLIVMADEVANEMDMQFSVSLTTSHVDSSSHGVYIPRSISPNNREWRVGEELTLTTNRGAWTVGLVRSGTNMRISAGWNRFVRENGMKMNDTLLFLLAEDDEEGIVFHVEVIDNN